MRSLLTTALAAALAVVFAGAAHAADGWGDIKGQVKLDGAAPPVTPVAGVAAKEPKCAQCNIVNDVYLVGKNGGVKDVIVWLQKGSDPKAKLPLNPALKGAKLPPVVIDQPCCKFEPRALAIREGQTIVGKNSSTIAHNMKWTGGDDNPGDNKLIPAGGKIEITDLVASKSAVIIECNIHPWMRGAVRVFSHPYFAVTDANGNFEIKGAPAGEYNIVMWLDGKGWVNGGKTGQTITIPAGGAVEVNEKLKPD